MRRGRHLRSLRRHGAKEGVLCAWCITSDGRKLLLYLAVGNKESEVCWTEFLRNMVGRGLKVPTVVEFVTAAGGRGVRTVELLTLDRPRAIHYRWLKRALPDVNETISFATIDQNTTRLAYRGAFSLGRGPLGWAIGLLRVKALFARLIGEHLQQVSLPAK